MKHYKFGYARVSTEQQNLARQLDMLSQYGVDYIFNEKMTGTKRDRPELNKLLDRMMEGDTVVIESLSRLGRSTKDLIELVELFRERGVHLVSLKEQIDTCPESRQDLKDEYQARYDVIAKYAPKLMDASEIKAYLTEKHADLIASGNKGQIMKTIMPELKGKADGKVINQVVALSLIHI